MTELFMVPATIAHAYDLCGDIRPEDNEEWVAASGGRTLPMLVRCIECNHDMAQAIVDPVSARTLLLFGATPSDKSGVGLAWLVATNAARRRVHSIHKHFVAGLELLHDRYPVLEAWAYHKNTLHHAWMLKVGFEKTGTRQAMGMGFDFLMFRSEREQHTDEARAGESVQAPPG